MFSAVPLLVVVFYSEVRKAKCSVKERAGWVLAMARASVEVCGPLGIDRCPLYLGT